MHIAQVAPLYESVPPKLYGGTERVVHYLTEELIAEGHKVTLFASADSKTSAELVAVCPSALRLRERCVDPIAHHYLMMERLFQVIATEGFDIVHFHTDYLHFHLARRAAKPHVTTMHGRLDLEDIKDLHAEFSEIPLVSISHAQRWPLPTSNWVGNVYHGLPRARFRLQMEPGDYLAFLGRVSPEKGLLRAIEIAEKAGMPLRIAAKIDERDKCYFDAEIKPRLRPPEIEFIGEIGEHDKEEFLGHAYALLFPIDWPEPFGLVIIEALACGTPVVAFNSGSVPEILREDVTGFIVSSVDQAVAAVARLAKFDRALCRREFEERFSAERMARDYVKIFARLISRHLFPSEFGWELHG